MTWARRQERGGARLVAVTDQHHTAPDALRRLPAWLSRRPADEAATRSGAEVSSSPTRVVVMAIFDGQVRAQQAATALYVWARANRTLGVGSIAMVSRSVSGATSCRTEHVLRPGRGALIGLLSGMVLFALPAGGAAALAAWVVGSVVLGLLGLVGVVPTDSSGTMTATLVVVVATLAAIVIGAVGALVGTLIGAVVGLIDNSARGLNRSDIAQALAKLRPGSAAAVTRTATTSSPLVAAELARLGGIVEAEAGPTAGTALAGGETPAPQTSDRSDNETPSSLQTP
jgi:hypothetical protein